MTRDLVVIGNPGCRGVGYWKAAARKLGWARFDVLPYADLLRGREPDTQHAAVRIESPGGDWGTYQLLLKHGRELALSQGYPALDDAEIDRLIEDRGWLVRPKQAHLGYLRLLESIDRHSSHRGLGSMNSVEEIALCYDKPKCQAMLADRDVPIPEVFGSPRNYDELRAITGERPRVMVKLAHGSGAAGCIAIHYGSSGARAVTTVASVTIRGESRLYQSKRPVYLSGESAIASLVDRLGVEGIHVEAWLPKARWQGNNIDLRVVTIAGEPRHTVARSSPNVFTNLTLGNRRAEMGDVVRRMGLEAWGRIQRTCATVAAAFPKSFTLGIDVLVRPDWRSHQVLEVNAFGDLLLNVFDRGENTYTATLNAWTHRGDLPCDRRPSQCDRLTPVEAALS